MSPQRNHTLELLKLFASYMVVFVHLLFTGKTGVAVDALARFAVPFFFLVSGYYSYGTTAEKIKKRIKNILGLLILSSVCYTLFEFVRLLKYNPDGLAAFFGKYTDLSTYTELLVFNLPVSSGHLWYLLAALYVYVIFYFTTKFKVREKIIFAVSFSLLLLQLLLGEGLTVFGAKLPIHYLRNFALMGIPFFALGLFAKKQEGRIKNLPNFIIFVFALIGVSETVLSRFLFGENEVYVGSLWVLASVVCLFIKGAEVKYPAFLRALEGCSTYVYIFHIMISTIIFIIYGGLGIDIYSSVILENLHPIVVCVASTVFSFVFIKISKRCLKKFN